jgi:hypothetical protein
VPISYNSFYKLLAWCDYVDSIHPTPPSAVVEFPKRCDDSSNAPLLAIDKLVSKDPSTLIVAKRDGSDLCLQKDLACTMGKPHSTSLHPSVACLETLNALQTVRILLGGRASNVLMTGNLYL